MSTTLARPAHLDPASVTEPVGFHHFHSDPGMNFQANRWLQWIGPHAYDELRGATAGDPDVESWIERFLTLSAELRSARPVDAAYYGRAADFFMTPGDPRRAAARTAFVVTMREAYGVQPTEVPFDGGALPAYALGELAAPRDTIVVFGGFDSYIEEFFPLLAHFAVPGRRVIAFDGPGQGGALEDHGLRLTHRWERPVAAVFDAFGVEEATLVGVSLGGGLAIQAAAREPRVRRVVAFDILDNELEVIGRQVGRGATPVLRTLLRVRARAAVNAIARQAARTPLPAWGQQQGMHITGTATPYEFLRSAQAYDTRSISQQVTADALLLAGADDHYVPRHQLHRQAATLSRARSVTTRTFTADEHASSHCQIGNIGLAARVISEWVDGFAADPRAVAAAR